MASTDQETTTVEMEVAEEAGDEAFQAEERPPAAEPQDQTNQEPDAETPTATVEEPPELSNSIEKHEEGEPARNVLDFVLDPPEEMTFGRRLALWLNQNYSGLYGHIPSPTAPSLEKAWAFFEHVTLQRHVVDKADVARSRVDNEEERLSSAFNAGDRKLDAAKPGEQEFKTRLYPIFSTPLSQLGDFGLGFGIYFATLRDFALLALLGGLLSVPNIIYFASSEYDSLGQEGVPPLLKGSAICTDRTWVPCPTCSSREFEKQNEGAYPIKRFSKHWVALPSSNGYVLNVTSYLSWANQSFERADGGQVLLDSLEGNSIPEDYGIVLDRQNGYLINGTNITAQMNGTTPLWCGYLSDTDCYLDLYPFLADKHDYYFADPLLDTRIGDSNFLRIFFALKNNCNGATTNQGFINYGTLLIMIVGSAYIYYRTTQIESKFDEDEQTAQDYSIVVKNPPPDAWDPNEWKDFFERALDGGDGSIQKRVVVCSVNVDNDLIVGYMVKRREIRRRLQIALPPETVLDTETLVREVERAEHEYAKACGPKSAIPKLVQRLQAIDEKIKEFFKEAKEPDVSRIFLTFETEAAQRQILAKMAVGRMDALNNNLKAVDPQYLFRGKYVLEVREPDEPTAIRWHELSSTNLEIRIRKIATSVVTGGFIVAAFYAVRKLYLIDQPWLASIVTTLFTSMFPIVANFLMKFEKHHTETSRQQWLFVKIASFNILVTTVLLALITPFQATLDKRENSLPGLLPAVQSLFVSQLCLTPLVQILDIGGNISRHLMAPRAKTQEEMNMCMKGTPVQLAARYANLIKFLFMTLWYCSIYPAAFFLGSLALCVTYFVDRFSLLRSWARSAQVGSDIANYARNYYTPLAVCLMSIASAYFWAGFPYDNLCLVENATVPDYYQGEFEVNYDVRTFELFGYRQQFVGEEFDEPISIAASAGLYKYCSQDLRFVGFPALPQLQPAGGEWMTMEQEQIVAVHGWSSLALTLLLLVTIVVAMGGTAYTFFIGKHRPRGEDQHISFSDVRVIDSYIPQVSSPLITYPLLLCNIDDIAPSLFSWQDEEHPHTNYDITRDVASVLKTDNHPRVFAQVKHWHTVEEKLAEESPAKGKDDQAEGGVVSVYDKVQEFGIDVRIAKDWLKW